MPPANPQNIVGCGFGYLSKDEAIAEAESLKASRHATCAILFQTDEQVEEICARIRICCCKEDPETPPEGIKNKVKAGEKAHYYDLPHNRAFRRKVASMIDFIKKSFPEVFKQNFYAGEFVTTAGLDANGQEATDEVWHVSSQHQEDLIYTLIKDQCKRLEKDEDMRDPEKAANVDRRVWLKKSPKKDMARVDGRAAQKGRIKRKTFFVSDYQRPNRKALPIKFANIVDQAEKAEFERPGRLPKDNEDYKPEQFEWAALRAALHPRFKFDADDANLKLIVKIHPEPSANELIKTITLPMAGVNTSDSLQRVIAMWQNVLTVDKEYKMTMVCMPSGDVEGIEVFEDDVEPEMEF